MVDRQAGNRGVSAGMIWVIVSRLSLDVPQNSGEGADSVCPDNKRCSGRHHFERRQVSVALARLDGEDSFRELL
jgi:hypothetical protein